MNFYLSHFEFLGLGTVRATKYVGVQLLNDGAISLEVSSMVRLIFPPFLSESVISSLFLCVTNFIGDGVLIVYWSPRYIESRIRGI